MADIHTKTTITADKGLYPSLTVKYLTENLSSVAQKIPSSFLLIVFIPFSHSLFKSQALKCHQTTGFSLLLSCRDNTFLIRLKEQQKRTWNLRNLNEIKMLNECNSILFSIFKIISHKYLFSFGFHLVMVFFIGCVSTLHKYNVLLSYYQTK